MNTSKVWLFVLFALISVGPTQVLAQTNPAANPAVNNVVNDVRAQIVQPVDETKLTVLRGNTHPLARPEFDRGEAPGSLPMDGMLLVLKRSPEQEAALTELMDEQQQVSSPNYHRWLTPEEFGQQFGPADQDVNKITAWLSGHGFQSVQVSHGRTVIEFSGTAAQVKEAFHTSIHKYVLSTGEEHWSNASDPSIPMALTPAVFGVTEMNNFGRKAMHHVSGRYSRSSTGELKRRDPQFTFPDSNCDSTCFALGPADFATIYKVPSSLTGTGQTIAVVSDSDINIQDVRDFRLMFGLPAKDPVFTVPTSISGCVDPGIQPNGDEIEAALDVEWSGGVASNANINLVSCASTNTTFGGDLAAEYIIDHDNPVPQIMSESYGLCELELGSNFNAFYNSLWQQAAGEGITVIVSTGDNGSAGCDIDEISGPPLQPAQLGLQVNGLASTPYNIAVGGTEFNDVTNPLTYWSTANNVTTLASAKSYIPEMSWNDSCTDSVVYNFFFGFTTASAACNSATVEGDGFVIPVGGSGGVSTCTTYNGVNPLACTGGYAKPAWQVGLGVPSDGKRDLPDVSLFAGDGTISESFYALCEMDQTGNEPCTTNLNTTEFLGVGGTSVSAQAFAGIMALVDQKTGARQGNANPILYSLAGEQSATSCNSAAPASTCVFNDVTVGTIAQPCTSGTPNCSGSPIGVLTGYSAGTGYDLATGLGSVNVTNLANSFGPNFYVASSSPTVTVAAAGDSGMMTFTLTSVGGFAGNVTLGCSGLPTGATCVFSPVGPIALTASGAGSSQTIMVTVNTTTASGIFPASHPRGGWWTVQNEIALAFVFCIGIVMYWFRENRWRLSAALAMVALAFAIGIAGCGGGSSSGGGGGGGGGSSTTTPNVTASSGSVTYNMSFTLTID